jgi:phosphoribosyl 1,2-cyclic phosphodiesterase
MFIRCWGSRGSIPVSGKQYIKYGGDTTCIEIRTKSDDIIIVDAGTGIRRLGYQLMQEGRFEYHFILTHAHWDHIIGFPFFTPNFSKNARIRMYRGAFHIKYLKNVILKVMAPPNFPLRYSDISAEIIYEKMDPGTFQIGSVTVIPIPLSHPNTGCGYKFIEDGKSFVFLTDNELSFIHPKGLSFDAYLKFTDGVDLLIHDAEYTAEEYQTRLEWGHSVYTDTLDLAIQAGVKSLGLFHLNQERSDQQMDMIVDHCKQLISKKGSHMDCKAVAADMTFTL